MGQRDLRSSRVLGCSIRIKIPKGARVGLPMLVHPDHKGMSNIWGNQWINRERFGGTPRIGTWLFLRRRRSTASTALSTTVLIISPTYT